MKSNWTIYKKPEVLLAIENAGVTDKEAIKCILKFERRVFTLWNMLRNGSSWNAVCESYAYFDASKELDKLNGEGFGGGQFSESWSLYCQELSIRKDANLGDFLC